MNRLGMSHSFEVFERFVRFSFKRFRLHYDMEYLLLQKWSRRFDAKLGPA